MTIKASEFTRKELNELAFQAGLPDDITSMLKTKQDVVDAINTFDHVDKSMRVIKALGEGRRISTSIEGKAVTAVQTADVINLDQIVDDAVHAGKGIKTFKANHGGHLAALVKAVDAALLTGKLTLAEPDDKGAQEIIGECLLRDLFTKTRAACKAEHNPNGNDYTAQSAAMKIVRENLYKDQIKSAVKKRVEASTGSDTTDAFATMLVNDSGNPRYISFSMGTKTDATIKLYLTAGQPEWELESFIKTTADTLSSRIDSEDCTKQDAIAALKNMLSDLQG